MIYRVLTILFVLTISFPASAGTYYVSGKVTSLLSRGQDPAIRLTGNVTPDLCDGGASGWLGFQGTAEEQARVYATAMAMALAGKTITVYTNSDGEFCEINNIQITNGLN